MSSVTIAAFRTKLQSFSDSNTYPDWMVQFWLDAADMFTNEQRWGDARPFGICLYVAHFISVDALMAQEVALGGVGGLRSGAISSESGDKVSVTYDLTGTAEEGGGHWNQTVWGKRYIHMARLMGMGGLQVGVPGDDCGGASAFQGGAAWTGPMSW